MNIAGSIIKNDIGEPYESYYKWLLDLCCDTGSTRYDHGDLVLV